MPFKNVNFLIGFVLVAMVIFTAILSLFYTPYNPNRMEISARFLGPSGHHWLGTDHYGRDVLSRVMKGAVNSITVGIIAVGIGAISGVFLGMISGYYSGWLDEITMRAMDVVYGFPAVITAILITSILGPGIENSIIAIGIYNIPIFARLSRASFLSLKERDYVTAARAVGRGNWGIIWKHILPNALSPLIIQATVSFAIAILAEAGLSYLGLGTQPPHPSWGRMLQEAQVYMSHTVWPAVFPGLAIAIAVLGFNLLGDGLRDVLDPRLAHLR